MYNGKKKNHSNNSKDIRKDAKIDNQSKQPKQTENFENMRQKYKTYEVEYKISVEVQKQSQTSCKTKEKLTKKP